MEENLTEFQTMNIKDFFVRSYLIYKDDFLKFIGIVLFLKGPYLILAYIISKIMSPSLVELLSTGGENNANFEYLAGVIVVEFLELAFIPFISPISVSAITISISEKYLKRDLGVVDTYKRVMKRALPLFGTVLLSGMLISSGFILALTLMAGSPQLANIVFLFAPVLSAVFWVWYAFIPQIVVIEGEGGNGAMKRSKYLTEGHFKRIFILVVLVFAGLLLITWLLSFGFSKMLFFLGDNSAFLGKGLSNVISVILEPFRIIIIPLLYFELRFRKEGFNLEILEKELEAEAE